ncbi:DNA polymerase I, partial [bacterium]|nr:DNA polymerase I [bacterium]
EERKTAKIINFGIIYGMSSYGLALELGISQTQAQEYIKKYFMKYEGIKKFIDEAIDRAKKDGYVVTLFNRRRYLPEIQSKNRILKEFAERVAINMPIQGTSADIIKIAMVQIDSELKNKNLKSRMLLQIHDELIFEVPQEEKEVLIQIAKEKMETAVKMEVPMKVNIKTGENWGSMG